MLKERRRGLVLSLFERGGDGLAWLKFDGFGVGVGCRGGADDLLSEFGFLNAVVIFQLLAVGQFKQITTQMIQNAIECAQLHCRDELAEVHPQKIERRVIGLGINDLF